MRPLFTLFIGFWISLGIARLLIHWAPALGLMDIPGGRRQHAHPVALVGGLALILALLVRDVMPDFHAPVTILEYMAVISMAVLGLVDDRFDLRARWKAGLGLGIAFLLAWTGTLEVAHAGHVLSFLGINLLPTSWAIPPLLVLMYWGLPHGFNLIDGDNGLAIGFCLVVLGSLWAAGTPHLYFIGALLGCLTLNWPHAKLFLGDCGSLSLGLLLVLLAKHALLLTAPSHIPWLFAYPTVDVTLVVLIRLATGRHLGVGDRNHLHYQLRDRWRTKFLTAPILLALAALCASEVYLTGAWRIIPLTGLSLLVGLALALGTKTLAEARTGQKAGPLGTQARVAAGVVRLAAPE